MLFKQTFSKLTVNPQIIQEVIDMTETKKRPKRFILRRLIVVAAVLALAFALAMGANAATGGELFEKVITFTTFGDDGSCYVMTINTDAVKQAGEEGATIFSFTEQEGEKTLMACQDSDGNVTLKEVDLSDPQKIIDDLRAEAEAEKSAEKEIS